MNNHARATVILAVMAAACIEDDLAGVAETEAAIQDGFDDVDTPVANSTVWIDNCTGTLVSPTQVLTSAHCRSMTYPGNFPPPGTITAGFVRDGEIVVATSGRRLYTVRANPTAFTSPWTLLTPMSGVSAATSYGDVLYVVQRIGITDVLWQGDGSGTWVDIGTAANTIGLAATSADLYALASGQIFRRARLGTDLPWTLHVDAAGATALTADRLGNLFAGFSDGSIRVYVDAEGWRPVGTLAGVNELASDGDYLLAVAGGQLHLRRAQTWPLVGWSAAGPATSMTAMAVTQGTKLVYGFRSDSMRQRRPLVDTWRARETLPAFVAMASAGSDLFAIDSARNLSVRGADDTTGTWIPLGPQTSLSFRAMVGDGSTLYAATNLGLWKRPATRGAASWTFITANSVGMDLREIAVAAGHFYAVNGAGRLLRRPVTDAPAHWTDVGEFDHSILLGAASTLYAVESGAPWLKSAVADTDVTFDSFERFEFESTIVPRGFAGDTWVKFGNDLRKLDDRRIKACYYRHAGETDVMLVELDSPVSPAWATPANVLYEPPWGNPSFWASQRFTIAGWGQLVGEDDLNKLVRRSGSSWVEIGETPGNTMSISRATSDIFVTVSTSGSIRRKEGIGPWTSLTQDSDATAAVALGRTVFVVRSTSVRYLDEDGLTVLATFTPTLAPGERLTAGALMAGLLYVATSNSRLLRLNVITSAWTDMSLTTDARALAADGGYLYRLSRSGLIYRTQPGSGGWVYLGNGDPATGLAAGGGTLFGSYPGETRYRQTAVQDDWAFDAARPHMGSISGLASVHPGDSGGPAYWTNTSTGIRYVMGVAQGGDRYFLTFFMGALLGNRVMQNISGWLDHFVARGDGTPVRCPPTLPKP